MKSSVRPFSVSFFFFVILFWLFSGGFDHFMVISGRCWPGPRNSLTLCYNPGYRPCTGVINTEISYRISEVNTSKNGPSCGASDRSAMSSTLALPFSYGCSLWWQSEYWLSVISGAYFLDDSLPKYMSHKPVMQTTRSVGWGRAVCAASPSKLSQATWLALPRFSIYACNGPMTTQQKTSNQKIHKAPSFRIENVSRSDKHFSCIQFEILGIISLSKVWFDHAVFALGLLELRGVKATTVSFFYN